MSELQKIAIRALDLTNSVAVIEPDAAARAQLLAAVCQSMAVKKRTTFSLRFAVDAHGSVAELLNAVATKRLWSCYDAVELIKRIQTLESRRKPCLLICVMEQLLAPRGAADGKNFEPAFRSVWQLTHHVQLLWVGADEDCYRNCLVTAVGRSINRRYCSCMATGQRHRPIDVGVANVIPLARRRNGQVVEGHSPALCDLSHL